MLKIVKKPAAAEATTADANVKTVGAGQSTSGAQGMGLLQGQIPMATVHLQVKYSHKLPSEDWISVEIGLDLPCKHDEIDKMHAYAKEWTDAKLNLAVEEITAA